MPQPLCHFFTDMVVKIGLIGKLKIGLGHRFGHFAGLHKLKNNKYLIVLSFLFMRFKCRFCWTKG